MLAETRNARLLASTLTATAMVAVALLISACGSTEAKMVAEEAEETAIAVEIGRVATIDIHATMSATAVLEATSDAEVQARVAGDVIALLVEEGDSVEAGQMLARIDARRLELRLEQAAADLRRLERDLDRQSSLLAQGLASEDAYDNAHYQYQQQRAAYELAELELSYATVRAPFAGVISARYVKLGHSVTADTAMYRVTDPSQLEARFQVPQHERERIQEDQRAALVMDALPGQIVTGAVDRISPVVDARTGTYKVTVRADTSIAKLLPGMFTRLQIVYDTHPAALVIPSSAILEEDGVASVYVVRDGIAELRIVETGLRQGEMIEILDGLSAEDAVVTLGHGSIRDGVKVAQANESAASA